MRPYLEYVDRILFFLSPELRQKFIRSRLVKWIIVVWLLKNIPLLIILIRKIKLLGLLTLMHFLSSSIAIAQNPLQSGNYWYEKRAENYQGLIASSINIDKAISYYYQASQYDSLRVESKTGLLASLYYKYKYVPGSRSSKEEITNQAKGIAEEILLLDTNNGPALYWSALALGIWVESHGIVAGATNGIASKLKNVSETLLTIEPGYREGGAYRLLGVLNLYTPRIPFLLPWPSRKGAISYFEKATQLYPDHPGNYLGLAKCYLLDNKENLAIPLLQIIIQSTPRKEFIVEDLQLKDEAQKIYRDLNMNFSQIIKTERK